MPTAAQVLPTLTFILYYDHIVLHLAAIWLDVTEGAGAGSDFTNQFVNDHLTLLQVRWEACSRASSGSSSGIGRERPTARCRFGDPDEQMAARRWHAPAAHPPPSAGVGPPHALARLQGNDWLRLLTSPLVHPSSWALLVALLAIGVLASELEGLIG